MNTQQVKRKMYKCKCEKKEKVMAESRHGQDCENGNIQTTLTVI